ncbi:hypothetical protein B7494_g5311 [Chlorociboria aeruginascens]|nr:hypothetical protein B7494_g5311 [Chlorociboria aeruginascens]
MTYCGCVLVHYTSQCLLPCEKIDGPVYEIEDTLEYLKNQMQIAKTMEQKLTLQDAMDLDEQNRGKDLQAAEEVRWAGKVDWGWGINGGTGRAEWDFCDDPDYLEYTSYEPLISRFSSSSSSSAPTRGSTETFSSPPSRQSTETFAAPRKILTHSSSRGNQSSPGFPSQQLPAQSEVQNPVKGYSPFLKRAATFESGVSPFN